MSEQESLTDLLSELDKLKTPEEKQAYVLEHFNKKEKEQPKINGISEHAGVTGSEPLGY